MRTRVASIVPNLKCACGETFRACVFARENWMTPCPACGSPVHVNQTSCDGTPRFYGNRRFHGTESVSMMQGYHPDEVLEARKNLPSHQHCIRDDGSVVFADRKEETTFVKAQHEWFQKITPPPKERVIPNIWGG